MNSDFFNEVLINLLSVKGLVERRSDLQKIGRSSDSCKRTQGLHRTQRKVTHHVKSATCILAKKRRFFQVVVVVAHNREACLEILVEISIRSLQVVRKDAHDVKAHFRFGERARACIVRV